MAIINSRSQFEDPNQECNILLETPPRPLYQYTSLPVKDPSFRLLRISPVLEDGLIRCELVIENFPEDVKEQQRQGLSNDGDHLCYNALSYEWGCELVFGWILLNDGCIKVGKYLFNFLHTARAHLVRGCEPKLPEYIWTDALCINQEDVKEKKHQIELDRFVPFRDRHIIQFKKRVEEGMWWPSSKKPFVSKIYTSVTYF
ncbi:hypothetical protein P171DRAFT_432474 [Karstenula rhodostoma CBS 690.94]|uniref:Heterokaryon incompatibility domain-containing protein n=1 Tax=Karstenula rhodostoma CBS 690.94 TaxID=1392251 RepID=A0A9P4PJQ2_9PLEO|nr:hypothetical protein P171DRAFT_432474 [Karstenula rhodostoma CBS 690.94]